MINVAFCIDEEFWHPLLITISSLLFTNPVKQFRLFIVSSAEVTGVEQSRLSEIIAAAGNATFDLIVFRDTASYGHLPIHGHLSLATYLRLYLAEFLPSTVDKVIYLDGDVLVRTSRFEDLWNIELGNAYLGAALEPFDPRQRLPLGFGPDDFYFNAGVMVVNVRKWRDNNVLSRFLEFAESNRSILYSPDQDILNSVFRGEVIDIGVRWNWQALFPRLTPTQLHISGEDFATWKHAPCIVHFTSRYKPWSWRWAPHYQTEYVRFLNKSPWKSNRPDKHIKHLPLKLHKVSQRFLEWHHPALAKALREMRRIIGRVF